MSGDVELSVKFVKRDLNMSTDCPRVVRLEKRSIISALLVFSQMYHEMLGKTGEGIKKLIQGRGASKVFSSSRSMLWRTN